MLHSMKTFQIPRKHSINETGCDSDDQHRRFSRDASRVVSKVILRAPRRQSAIV